MTIDDVLTRLSADLDLEADRAREVLDEIRFHLEQAVDRARARGLDAEVALAQAAAQFGIEDVSCELHATHAGWGTADGVLAAALPVACTLLLRWMAFAPDGTAVGWQAILTRPSFWFVAVVMLGVPVWRFKRWRYALVSWAFFWTLSVVFFLLPALRW